MQSSGTLSVGKINSKIYGIKTRSIINFAKNVIHSGFDDLDIDIKLKSKTDPKTTIYVVVYGVTGIHSDVSIQVWDRFYYYDNDSLNYEVPIDMNGKKIKGVGDGINDNDAVNVKQFNSVAVKNEEIINKIINYMFKKDAFPLLKDVLFPDNLIGYTLDNSVYTLGTSPENDEDEVTFYFVFQHNSSTNDIMKIEFHYLGLQNYLYINISKNEVKIEQGSDRKLGFNIPNICLGKQLWFWIWIHNSNFNLIFSKLSPKKSNHLTGNNNLSFIRIIDFRSFQIKRALMSKNIYDNKSDAFLKMKKFEESKGTIT